MADSPAPSRPSATTANLAQLFAMDERSVRRLAQEKTIVRLSRDKWDLFASITKYILHLREAAAGRSTADGSLDVVKEGAMLKRAQRLRREFEAEQIAGTLIRVDLVEQVMADHILGIRQMIEAWSEQAQAKMPHLPAEDIETLRTISQSILKDNALRAIESTGKHPGVERAIETQRAKRAARR